MKLVTSLLVAAGLVACGASQDMPRYEYVKDSDGLILEIVDLDYVPEDIGTSKQPYSGKTTANYQYGTSTAATHMQCNRSSSGQVCTVPMAPPGMNSPKAMFYHVQSAGMTAAQVNEMTNAVEAVDAALSGWTFTPTNDPLLAHVILNRVTCAGSGGSDITSFACTNLTANANNLSEGVGVVGSYTNHTFGVVHVDWSDINATWGTTIDRLLVGQHATVYGLLSWMGLGGRSDAGATSFMSSRTANPAVGKGYMSTGEVCRAQSYVPTADGAFTISGNCAGAD